MKIHIVYTGDNVPRGIGNTDQQDIVMAAVNARGRVARGTLKIKGVCNFKWKALLCQGDCYILAERHWAWKERKPKQYPRELRWSSKVATAWRNRVKDSCWEPKPKFKPEPKPEFTYEEIVEYLKSLG